jgi:hypothetical protein
MTSSNESVNDQAEATTNGTSTQKTTSTRSTSTRRAASKSSLVKADNKSSSEVVFVLEDNTRIAPTEYLPNHRPIALSEFTIVGSLNMAGDRPIMADGVQVYASDLLPGHRPVAVNTLPISDLHFLPNNRPIAPNDIVDPPAPVLMGYLD